MKTLDNRLWRMVSALLFGGLTRFQDIGLLLLRLGMGVAFVCHGYPKVMGGPEKWAALGGALGTMGIEFAPTVMGLLAALSEFGGGLCLMAGLLTRPACFMLLCTMTVATTMHVRLGDSFTTYSHALEAAIVFLGLLVAGPGRYAVDTWLAAWMSRQRQPSHSTGAVEGQPGRM